MLETAKLVVRAGGSRDSVHCDDCSDSEAEQAKATSPGQRPAASRPDEVLIFDRDERAPVAAADERHVRNTHQPVYSGYYTNPEYRRLNRCISPKRDIERCTVGSVLGK